VIVVKWARRAALGYNQSQTIGIKRQCDRLLVLAILARASMAGIAGWLADLTHSDSPTVSARVSSSPFFLVFNHELYL
jgi:hypothetical protein